MKKIVVGFVVIIGMLLFNSCTDNSLEEIENNEKKENIEIHNIDRGDIEAPGSQGQDND